MSIPRLLRSSSRLLPQTTHPNSFSRGISFLTQQQILEDKNPFNKFMEYGEFALKAAFKNHLSKTYPHLHAHSLAALRDLNLSEEKLAIAADRLSLDMDGHWLIVTAKRGGIAFEEPLLDSVVAFAGVAYVVHYDLHKFWESYRRYFDPIATPEDMEKQTLEELELHRAGSTQALSRRPIKILDMLDIMGDENPVQRLEGIGAYALNVAMKKHLSKVYPELSATALTALRNANVTPEVLTAVAARLGVKKRTIWPKFEDMDLDEPMSDCPVALAGKIFVDANYDLDNFWMRFKVYLDIIYPEHFKKSARGIQES